jgi:hypothetical protein
VKIAAEIEVAVLSFDQRLEISREIEGMNARQ